VGVGVAVSVEVGVGVKVVVGISVKVVVAGDWGMAVCRGVGDGIDVSTDSTMRTAVSVGITAVSDTVHPTTTKSNKPSKTIRNKTLIFIAYLVLFPTYLEFAPSTQP
jgi:hypothetical protein